MSSYFTCYVCGCTHHMYEVICTVCHNCKMDVCLCCTDRDENNNDVCVKCTDAKMFNPGIDEDDLVDTKTITTMNISNVASKAMIWELLQDEIDRCKMLVKQKANSTRTWSSTVGVLIDRDIQIAEKAIEEKNDNAMFHALLALRLNN